MTEKEQELHRIVSEYAHAHAMGLDADLYDDLGLDSFGAVDFLLAAESRLGITLSKEHFIAIRRPRELLHVGGDRGVRKDETVRP